MLILKKSKKKKETYLGGIKMYQNPRNYGK